MFKSLNRVVYRVPDVEKAKQWYRQILNTSPRFDSPFAVVFPVGDSELVLTPNANPVSKNDEDIVAYWGVDDVDSAYNRLLQSGAAPHIEITTVLGTRRASVCDPFGNILGIMGTAADRNSSTVEQRPSESAMGVTFMRALTAMDERDEIRGHDHLAQIFLTQNHKTALEDRSVRQWYMKNPPGVYEFFIARTAFFDHIFEQALRENISQIVFLGAGYDSRPYRFKDTINESVLFEVDIHTTQQHKRELLKKANISIPDRLIYVTVNFSTDNLKDVLFKAGFDQNKETVYIWEGVTYYLSSAVVDQTLSFIKSSSPVGSTVCFDYSPSLSDDSGGYGVRETREAMKASYPGEPILFSIERGKIGSFLSDRGYRIIDHLTAKDMEKRYLTLRDGSSAGRVTDSFCFVQAAVSD